MNILILSTHFNTGGISRYILGLARGLRQKNHKVFVGTSGGDMLGDLTNAGAGHLTLNIRTKSELDLRLYLALGLLSKFIKENNIDIIHAQTRVTQVMGSALSRLTGKPCMSTCHGFFKTRLSRKIFPGWGEAVIAISEAVRDHLLNDFKVPAQKVFLIPNGIDVGEFPLVSEDEKYKRRQEFNLGHEPLIGIVARLSDVKGHDVLIAAMKKVIEKVPSVKLLIVGQGREEATLKEMVKELDLEDHVVFSPVVNQTAGILSMLDVFVMPSLQEGLGLSVMEAQASGLPVVASKVGGIPSLINDGVTGLLVPPQHVDALAKAIVILLENKELAKRMGLAARQFIAGQFSAEQMVEGTLKVYGRLAGKSHG